MSAPVGNPDVPEGGIIFRASIHASGQLAVGEYTRDANDLGRMTHISVYHSSGRINPLGQHTIVITEITDEHICGEINGVGETELQRFPTLSGRFRLDRI